MRLGARPLRANTDGMETVLWIGLGVYIIVGLVLGIMALVTMVRNAGRR